jgi:hypothetical protein
LLKILREKGESKAYLGGFILPVLAEFGYTKAIPEMKLIVNADPTDVLAAEALWQLNDRSGYHVIMNRLESERELTRRDAATTIAKLGDKRDVAILARCLDDDDWGVKAAACKGLERITGMVKRADMRTDSSEHDAPLWKEWFEKHKDEYEKAK